ncbi:MAG TPA: sugar phosphate isomerase/epimerase [Capillimicrobium sp.]|nr:sugar phosphate isomerase/epimerase [Capillimicrobium sp.]
MRFGASTFIWHSPFGDESVGQLADRAAGLGFDVLEICIEDPALVTAAAVRDAAEDAGVGVSVCGAFGPDRDVSHEDPEVRRGAIGYLKTCIDLAADVGAPNVSGPMYSATGKARLLSPEERAQQWGWAVESLGEVAEHAASRGVGLAIEPLNRFETDMVNLVEQGVRLCRDIGADNVGLLIDTFHMNIEERHIGEAIRAADGYVRNFHACENDRGAPGSGHVPWDEVAQALRDIEYDGLVCIESFTPEIKEIARAVSTWRPVAESGDQLARDGLTFLRQKLL